MSYLPPPSLPHAENTLAGMIEMDEGYFTVASSQIEQSKEIRGREAVGKANTLVMAESVPQENLEAGNLRYFKAKILNTHKVEEINQAVQKAIDNKSIVFTDQSISYVNIADFVELYITEKSSEETAKETLRWDILLRREIFQEIITR